MSKLFNFDILIGKVEAYMEARIKLATMNVKEEIASIVTRLLPLIILAFVFLLFVIFIGVTLGLLFNYLLQSSWLGFAIVTGFYLLIFLLLLWIKDNEKFKNFVRVKVLNMTNHPND